tara:strand:- start:182 stop:580 length:399 start_codon:yes stop_codon:yes gene_type:complete
MNNEYYSIEKRCKENIRCKGGEILKGQEYYNPTTIKLNDVKKIVCDTVGSNSKSRPRNYENSDSRSLLHNERSSHRYSPFVGLYVFEGVSPTHGPFIKIGRTSNLDARIRTYKQNGESIFNLTLYEVLRTAR